MGGERGLGDGGREGREKVAYAEVLGDLGVLPDSKVREIGGERGRGGPEGRKGG